MYWRERGFIEISLTVHISNCSAKSQNTDEQCPSGRVMAAHQASIEWRGDSKFHQSILDISNTINEIVSEEIEGGIKFTITASSVENLRKAVDSFLAECAIIEQS